ncbi:MAG TPA: RpiB/LacA/LacB family sugar-phosphate isomerase [Candidatus Tyrphobacter sp.]
MRIALGSDLSCELTDALERRLRERGAEPVLFGALARGAESEWPSVGRAVGEAVARGDCAQGILCCWTGTGVSIAANKVRGVRAALCSDAETARGARQWNDANVLALSIRLVTPAIAAEMLDAWFQTTPAGDSANRGMIESLKAMDAP